MHTPKVSYLIITLKRNTYKTDPLVLYLQKYPSFNYGRRVELCTITFISGRSDRHATWRQIHNAESLW